MAEPPRRRETAPAEPARRRETALILLAALVVRAVLVPITSGQDFRVWDLASSATLRGVDVYAHHPHYPGGPYAYLPLFLWLELPFQWLAQHTGIPFRIMGKLPIVAADFALGLLVRRELLRRGCSPRRANAALALVLLNPLMLYNGAYYGRFDSLAVALLVAAVSAASVSQRLPWRAAWWFALAVAAKTFPVVAVLGFARRGRSAAARLAVTLVSTVVVLLLPYRHSLPAVVHDVLLYDWHKQPQALSWQQVLLAGTPPGEPHWAGLVVLVAAALVVLAATLAPVGRVLDRYTVLTVLVFLLASKLVLEQYLTWPLPFVAILALTARRTLRTASWACYVFFSAVGLLVNPYIHPFGTAPRWLDAVLAGVAAAYVGLLLADRSADSRALTTPPGLRDGVAQV